MKFSLIGVQKRNSNGTIDGNWIQNHVGTLESAIQTATATEAVNGNKIDIAVVDEVAFATTGEMQYFRQRLDKSRRYVELKCPHCGKVSAFDYHPFWPKCHCGHCIPHA